jgi:site-specific DNA recombinase
MKPSTLLRPAIYARVSSERQAQQETIASQVAAIRDRVLADGLSLDEELVFVDDGCSGSSLMRPAMERLRDMAYVGTFDRLYVHSPDRLARRYVHQVMLLDELKLQGVEVVFVNHPIGEGPEEHLLLQVQGVIAEYEREKILERCRRGRRFAAQRGSVNAIAHAPYGYRYISKHLAGGESCYQVVADEAALVRQMFEWVGRDRLSLSAVSRRLHEQGRKSPRGKARWHAGSLADMLKNPAYKGLATYGKTRVGPRLPRLRAPRNQPEIPRRQRTCHATLPSERIDIPVPAIVSEELFAAVQEQLEENRRRLRQRHQNAPKYILQGLTVCGCCGSAYCAHPGHVTRQGIGYFYYRCVGTDSHRFGGERICQNRQVNGAAIEAAVWQDICEVLRHPQAVQQEFRRRLREDGADDTGASDQLSRQIQSARRAISRLIDAYTDELLTKDDFAPRLEMARTRLARLESQAAELARRQSRDAELKHAIGTLDEFFEQLRNGLENVDWTARREIIRTLVKAVQIEAQTIKIIYRIDLRPFADGPDRGRQLQHCRRFAIHPSRGE